MSATTAAGAAGDDKAPAKPPAKKAAAKKAATTDKPPAKRGRPSNSDKLAKDLAHKLAAICGAAAAVTMTQDRDDQGRLLWLTLDGELTTDEAAGAIPVMGMPRGSVARDFDIIAGQAEPLAAALVKVSERNDALRSVLDKLVTTGDYSSLASVVGLGIALPIMANHGLLPEQLAGLFGQPPA